jgi:hypothetical protein
MNKQQFILIILVYLNGILTDLIEFKDNSTKCSMFSNDCYVNFILRNITDLKNLKVTSSNHKLLKIKSIDSCNDLNNYQKCPDIISFKSVANREIQLLDKNIFALNLDSILVGKIIIFFNLNNNSYFNHSVVITQPKRIIDLIQQIYIIIFSLTTALIMGILLDIEKLKKILKIPIPVIIGFISQYLFMPLLAFGFISAFNLNPAESLALFIYGCSPGGSGSNNWYFYFILTIILIRI